MVFPIFCHVRKSDVHINVAKASHNRVNVCKTNPCEEKPQISDLSEHSASNIFLYSWLELTSISARFLYTVISRPFTAVFKLHTLLHVTTYSDMLKSGLQINFLPNFGSNFCLVV